MNPHITVADIAEALHMARQGLASEVDWQLIYWACGLRQQYQADPFFNFLSVEENK